MLASPATPPTTPAKVTPPRLRYSDVVSALGEAFGVILADFRARGGDKERWHLADWDVMAHALTSYEDDLELRCKGKMTPLRLALRTIRRQVEALLDRAPRGYRWAPYRPPATTAPRDTDDARDRPIASRRPPRRPLRRVTALAEAT